MVRKFQHRAGQKYGPYSLITIRGSGGNAEVWEAEGPSGRVAIKLLRKWRSEPYARFRREVAQLRNLGDTPGVLPYIDSRLPERPDKNNPPWLVLPLAIPLRDALGEDPTARSVVHAIASIAETLASLHMQGISHRDVKPENLYSHDGQWVIGDFGLVDAPDVAPLTEGAVNLGPRHYIAPEMINNPATAKGEPADVYSLAKTMWVLISGHRFPLPGEHRLDVAAMKVSSYTTDPGLASLDVLLEAMTRYDAQRRPSAKRVAEELGAWLQPTPTIATGASLSDIARRIETASQHRRSEAERLADREELADEAMSRFLAAAQVVVTICRTQGLSFVDPNNSKYGGFRKDRSNSYITENLSLIAIRKILGEDPPEPRTAVLNLQTSHGAPSLSVWIGVASIPRHDPEAAFLAGASTVDSFGHRTRLWSEQRWAIPNGPGETAAIRELVESIVERLPADAEAWAAALEKDSHRGD